MQLSVIIPTHLRFSSVLNLLDSIFRQNFPKNDFEILLVTNLPNIRLPSEIKKHFGQYSNWKFYCAGRIGVGCARNYGIEKARGQYLLFLDDDCFLYDSNYFNRLLAQMQEHPQASAIGGTYLSPVTARTRDQVYHKITENWLSRSLLNSASGETLHLLGGNTCYRKEVFSAGHRFDENIIFCGSDSEFNQRLYKQGHRLLLLQSLSIQHDSHLSLWQFLKKAFLYGQKSRHDSLDYSTKSQISRRDYSERKIKDLREFIFLQIYKYAFDRGIIWAQQDKKFKSPLLSFGAFIIHSLWHDFQFIYSQLNNRIQKNKFTPLKPIENQTEDYLQIQLPMPSNAYCPYCPDFNCHKHDPPSVQEQLDSALTNGTSHLMLPWDFLENESAFALLEEIRHKNLTPILRLPISIPDKIKQKALLLTFSGCQFEFVIDDSNAHLGFLDDFDKVQATYQVHYLNSKPSLPFLLNP